MSVSQEILDKGMNMAGFRQFLTYTVAPMINAIVALQEPEFTQAQTRQNIASGESLETILGKLQKYCSDIETMATKLNGIASGAEVNVQADWNESDSSADGYILHKPASLPANGGNAATVGGYTVGCNVPSNAVFTDTTYSTATSSSNGLMSATDKGNLDTHLQGAVASSSGAHGLRYYNSKLQYYDVANSQWTDIPMGVNVVYTNNSAGGQTVTIGGD